jgi:hypothetical protein
MGTRLEVCNLNKRGLCAIATVVDRGPADYLTTRTIDAYSVLSAALQMNCGTVPATYKVLSGPGINGEAQPSGPTTPGIEAILAAQRNAQGTPVQGIQYIAGQTPFGYGYVGTPPPIGSSAYSQIGTPNYTQSYTQTYPAAQIPLTQTSYTTGTNYSNDYIPGTNTSGTSGPPPASVMDIKVWPHAVIHGQSVLVYWTSVNMQQNSCQVLFQNQQFSQSNSGAKPFKTTSFDTAGSLTFTLKCTDQNGVVKSVSDSAQLTQ